MRHRRAGRKLNRTWEHRKAMFRNMAKSLLTYEQIRTTEAKAKELRKLSDRLISYGLEDSLHARRKAFRILESRVLVQKLFDDIAPRFKDRPGGYTRLLKLSEPRKGDAAKQVLVQLTTPAEAQKS